MEMKVSYIDFKKGQKQFGQFLHEGKVLKVCPDCRSDVTEDMKHCFKNEWCPFCGCNHNKVFK